MEPKKCLWIVFAICSCSIFIVGTRAANVKRSTLSDDTVYEAANGKVKVAEPQIILSDLVSVDIVKRSINDTDGHSNISSNSSHVSSNSTDHSGDVSGTHEEDNGHGALYKEHVSIHVASWNFDHVESPLIISVFLIAAGIAKLGFHHADVLSSRVPESCLLIILGTVVGAILYGSLPGEETPGLTSELFFLYLLPPIILESAYSLHDRTFYENIGTVLIYAVIGTVLNCFLIGPTLFGLYKYGVMGPNMPDLTLIQCLVFSAVVVAVDPVAVLAIFQEVGVNNTLYFLVFGESLLNDAVTVVLYNMMKTLNKMDVITPGQIFLGILQFFVVSLGGLSIGVIFGALTAIITKFTQHCRVVEPLAVFVLAYISYLVAEMFHFSGIISIIGCGLTQAQYAFHNISRKSFTTVKYFSKMMSATSDCVIFLFLGVALFKDEVLDSTYWHVGFIGWALLLCLVYRFIVVFGLTFFLNANNRLRKIDLEEQFIMAYGGLRGAVAFSLVDVLSHQNLPRGHFLITTLVLIFFTVFIQGSTIKPLVKLLRVRMESKDKPLIGEEINTHVTDHVMAGIEEILGRRGEYYFRELLEHYNTHYLKRWLQREPVTTDEQIMQLFEQMALENHFENLASSKMIQAKYGDGDFDENVSLAESETVSEGGASDIMLHPPSTTSSCEDISPEQDFLFLMAQTGRRPRKSLFPVAINKEIEERLVINPTSEDVRKIMLPSRRQMNYKKLDKNIKGADSSNDLLKYLHNKHMRTRRLSTVAWNQPSLENIPTAPSPMIGGGRRKSVGIGIANNYRRRLSLAETAPRPRGMSAGNILKGFDSPARRRLQMKRRTQSEVRDDSDLPTIGDPMKLDIIKEHSDENLNSASILSDSSKPEVQEGRRRSHSAGSATERRMQRMRQKQRSLDRSPPTGRFQMVRTPDRPLRFVPARDSPSTARRKRLYKTKTKSLDVDTEQALKEPLLEHKSDPEGGAAFHKSESYARAMSVDVLDDDIKKFY